MKFMPGYQLMKDDRYIDTIIKNSEYIHEVYFSFADMPSGRGSTLDKINISPYEAQNKQFRDLCRLAECKIGLNLLLNANCYGGAAQSRALFNQMGETVDYLVGAFGLRSVTTASPLVAKFVKSNFGALEIRASVNMRIGTVEGMEYLGDDFDGYYMQREYNRDFDRIRLLKEHCDTRGKKLYMLANSGCLNFCSAQTFHDNLVAHEKEASFMDNAYEFQGACTAYLKDEAHLSTLYEHTNFVRPEDMKLYDEYFVAAKLATRVHKDPARVLETYVRAKYSGNLLELLEPAHAIYPYVLENGAPPRLVKLDSGAIYDI